MLPNEPPTNTDYQDVPRHMTELIDLKNKVKAGKLKKRKKKKKVIKDDFIVVRNEIISDDTQGATQVVRSVPAVVKQKKFESEQKFFRRLQGMADNALAEAKMEQKYDIRLVDIDNKGNAQYVNDQKGVTEKKREKRKKYKDKEVERKKLKSEETCFELHKEKIDFNDVAMAPPIFTAKPRKAPALNKAGKKELALKNVLETKNKEKISNPKPLSIKLKNMPSEKRRILESERLRAVEMYRILKNKKKPV